MRKGQKRSILMALCAMLAWTSFVVDGAHALFTDDVTLSGNILTSGTAGLLISNSQSGSSTTYDQSRPGFDLTLVPGVPVEKYFLIKNTSQSDVTMDVDIYAVSELGMGSLRGLVTADFIEVDSTGIETGTRYSTLFDQLLENHTPVISQIPAGQSRRFKVTYTLDPLAMVQGESMTYDLLFTGTQHLGS